MSLPQPKDPKNNNSNAEINPEQALGLVSLSLMQKLSDKGLADLNWLKEDEKCDTYELRQRLELTSLAIETGAPLSTSEVSNFWALGQAPQKLREVVSLLRSYQEMFGD